jgi:hypothetical protein
MHQVMQANVTDTRRQKKKRKEDRFRAQVGPRCVYLPTPELNTEVPTPFQDPVFDIRVSGFCLRLLGFVFGGVVPDAGVPMRGA